jgi:hypothetical protein
LGPDALWTAAALDQSLLLSGRDRQSESGNPGLTKSRGVFLKLRVQVALLPPAGFLGFAGFFFATCVGAPAGATLSISVKRPPTK